MSQGQDFYTRSRKWRKASISSMSMCVCLLVFVSVKYEMGHFYENPFRYAKSGYNLKKKFRAFYMKIEMCVL